MVVTPVLELVKKLPGMTSAAIPAWIVPPRWGVPVPPAAWDWLTADSQPAAPNRDGADPEGGEALEQGAAADRAGAEGGWGST